MTSYPWQGDSIYIDIESHSDKEWEIMHLHIWYGFQELISV